MPPEPLPHLQISSTDPKDPGYDPNLAAIAQQTENKPVSRANALLRYNSKDREESERLAAENEELRKELKAAGEAYVPASWASPLYGMSLSKFSKWLASVPEHDIRRNKPSSNRLLVHARDLIIYMQDHKDDPKIVELLKQQMKHRP